MLTACTVNRTHKQIKMDSPAKAARAAIEAMTPEQKAELAAKFKEVQSQLINDNVVVLDTLRTDRENANNQAIALNETIKSSDDYSKRREIEKERQTFLTLRAELDSKILNQQNVVNALSNAGSLSSIVDEYGTKHENIADFRQVNSENITFDVKTILITAKPEYIPEIDGDHFKAKGYIFDAIRIDKDAYILAVDRYNESKFGDNSPNAPKDKTYGFGFSESRTNFVLLTLDQLVLTLDYYTTLAKANEIKSAADKNERAEASWFKRSIEQRQKYMDYYGKYPSLPAKVRKKINEPEWNAMSLEEKEEQYLPIKRYGTKRLKSKLDEKHMWSSFHDMYQRFINKDAARVDGKSKYGRAVKYANPETWAYWTKFREMMEFKIKDIRIQRQDLAENYKEALETSFGERNTDTVLKDKYGILVKRQNGDEIKPSEIEDIENAWSSAQNVFGDLKPNALKYNMKVSHSGKRLIFASKAIGVFIPSYNTIGVSMKYGYNQFESTMAHEIGHFMDYIVGQLNGKRWATDDYEDTAGKIAFEFRDHMNKPKNEQTDYINATKECFARAMQQYFGMSKYGNEAVLSHSYAPLEHAQAMIVADTFVDANNFNNKIKPLIQQFLKENNDVFKTTFDVDGSDTIEPIVEVSSEPKQDDSISDVIEGLKILAEDMVGQELQELNDVIEGLKLLV